MKFKTTKKAVMNGYANIIKIGYCRAQNLLAFEDEIAYSSGASGWACDYYDINGVCISTGYAPIGEAVDYELLNQYEKQAEQIRYNYNMTWEARRDAVRKVLRNFVYMVTTGGIEVEA